MIAINLQNSQNSYPSSKLTGIRNFTPSGRVLLKRGTHVASHGVFTLNKMLIYLFRDYLNNHIPNIAATLDRLMGSGELR